MGKRISLTKNLYLDEYIPKELYLQYEKSPNKLMWMLDKRLVDSDQLLRDIFGPVFINNWWRGGDRQWSGIRTVGSPNFNPTSQHAFGRASDKIFTDADELKIQEYVQKNWWKTLGVTGLELGVSWVHTDTRYADKLVAFKP
jgi:hypothetical protein